jgi:hypothetical protein
MAALADLRIFVNAHSSATPAGRNSQDPQSVWLHRVAAYKIAEFPQPTYCNGMVAPS